MGKIYKNWDEKYYQRLLKTFNVPGNKPIKNFSTGMKMKLMIVAAMAHHPKLLILDEATSSISSDTEKLIQDALEVMLRGRTSFIVAHRLSTIRNSDRILYIANKGIAEEGTHEQLLKQHGLYYNLYKNLNQ